MTVKRRGLDVMIGLLYADLLAILETIHTLATIPAAIQLYVDPTAILADPLTATPADPSAILADHAVILAILADQFADLALPASPLLMNTS
jgi:hypothetical protein